MADKKSDGAGGSSAGDGDEDLQDNLDKEMTKLSESCVEAANEITEEVKKSIGEKEQDVFNLQSESSSEDECESEKIVVDRSKRTGNVKEKLLGMLGAESSGSDSDGDGGDALEDSEILTNIEGLCSEIENVKAVEDDINVKKKTDAEELDDSFAGIAEPSKEADDEEED